MLVLKEPWQRSTRSGDIRPDAWTPRFWSASGGSTLSNICCVPSCFAPPLSPPTSAVCVCGQSCVAACARADESGPRLPFWAGKCRMGEWSTVRRGFSRWQHVGERGGVHGQHSSGPHLNAQRAGHRFSPLATRATLCKKKERMLPSFGFVSRPQSKRGSWKECLMW